MRRYERSGQSRPRAQRGDGRAPREVPNDFDACWEMAGVAFDLLAGLDPALLDWGSRRAAQKALFGGELFIAESAADPWGTIYLEFFQHKRDTGEPKDILAIDRRGLP